jgi:hypothetical protein
VTEADVPRVLAGMRSRDGAEQPSMEIELPGDATAVPDGDGREPVTTEFDAG